MWPWSCTISLAAHRFLPNKFKSYFGPEYLIGVQSWEDSDASPDVLARQNFDDTCEIVHERYLARS